MGMRRTAVPLEAEENLIYLYLKYKEFWLGARAERSKKQLYHINHLGDPG
jgi:hypothetical protein